MAAPGIDDTTRTELEAAAFRRLVEHLRARTDVQNIDLMNMAGFCRNCLSKWYRGAAEERGVALSDPEARETIYGMPYQERAGPGPAAREAATDGGVRRGGGGGGRAGCGPRGPGDDRGDAQRGVAGGVPGGSDAGAEGGVRRGGR